MSSSCAPTAVPPSDASPELSLSLQIAKKKRRPAGTPDLGAEVVALSPRALLEQGGRLACEICGQRFRREQNLQMHLRRHGAPWRLVRRAAPAPARRCVYVCPEPSCRFHDPSRALGDLTGVKKHFLRKHAGRRPWACARCSRAYAVLTDYKAHVRSCDERFREHLDTCRAGGESSWQEQELRPAAASGGSPSCGASPTDAAAAAGNVVVAGFHQFDRAFAPDLTPLGRPVVQSTEELQLMPPRGSCARDAAPAAAVACCDPPAVNPQLELSLWFGGARSVDRRLASASVAAARDVKAREQTRLAIDGGEYAAAEEARAQARRQVEMAGQELAIARRVRQL